VKGAELEANLHLSPGATVSGSLSFEAQWDLTFRNRASYIQYRTGTPLPSTHPNFNIFSTNTRTEFF
jgi:hypothetical protein